MSKFVLFYVGFVLLINAIIFPFFVSFYGLLLIIPAIGMFYAVRKLSGEKEIKVTNGLDLGMGWDIEDADSPRKVRVVLEEKSLDLGFLGIGGPGSGKSIGAIVFLIYYRLQRKIGWVYWEGKGDRDIYQKVTASCGTPDKFFSSELPDSDTTNVVAGPTNAVIEALTQTLITSESDYYRNAQREALGAIVPLLKSCGKPIILRDIYVVLKVDAAAQYVMDLAKENNVAADIIEVAKQFFEKEPDARANDVNGLMTKMSMFVTGDIAERLNAYQPTLDLVEASKKGECVYMHSPYSMLSKDISIMFTEQIGVIAKNRQLYDDVRVSWPQVFDDWGKFFYANVGAITARCRSAKMPVSYLFQSRGQTDAVDQSRIFTTEITDNIGGFISWRVNGQDTAEWVSKQFGTYESMEISASESSNHSGQSQSVQDKPLVRADKLKDMDAGECYISALVAGEGGRSSNKRLKARFPLPEFSNEKEIQWPKPESIVNNSEAEGLHLWREFMEKGKEEVLKAKIIQELEAREENSEKHSFESTGEELT
ncbi:MAG: TraM recognition domain-containing protein [Flavobacteriales bacterium]|nr:TraM recognition domain-containing protein [Flavobacteriales bacterium]